MILAPASASGATTSLLSPPMEDGHVSRPPRTQPMRLRMTALLILAVFAAVNIATTVFSLGAYCLTTYGGNPFSGIVP